MENKFCIADRRHSAAFTGHRIVEVRRWEAVKASVRDSISRLLDMDITNYSCGMAMGFDLLAAEVVVSMKSEHPQLTLTAVVPFPGQADRWAPDLRRKYFWLLSKADVRLTLSKTYYDGCFLVRNQFMLDHSCRLIEYYNGSSKGGTFYTHTRAERMGMPINNVF